MYKKLILIIVLIFSSSFSNLFAQIKFQDIELSYTHDSPIYTFQDNTLNITLTNNTGYDIFLIGLNFEDDWYSIYNDNLISNNTQMELIYEVIGNGETYESTITFTPEHNISYDLGFEVHFNPYDGLRYDTDFRIIKSIQVNANHQMSFYNSTFNLWGEELFNALKNAISNNVVYSYRDARTKMFSEIDNVDGMVETVYIGKIIETDGIPNVNATGVNTEHTWPRSKGADGEPAESDLYHLYPSDQNANSRRANYPFGEVESNVDWSEAGSSLGRSEDGITVFEPRDSHKGNVARSMFYFATRYGNRSNFLDNQEKVLRQWAQFDPVDETETARNNSIANFQENRNPYIDYPNFLNRLQSISKGKDTSWISRTKVRSTYDHVVSDFSYEFPITLRYIRPLESDNMDNISVLEDIDWLQVVDFQEFDIVDSLYEVIVYFDIDRFNEACQENECNATILVSGSALNQEFEFTFRKYISSIHDSPTSENLFNLENYPNPANGETTISFDAQITGNEQVELQLYNMLGQRVYDASAAIVLSEDGGMVRLDTSTIRQYGNTFIYQLRIGSYTQSKILLLN